MTFLPAAIRERSSPWSSLAGILGALGAAIGAGVLLGWMADVDGLKSILPGVVSMKANTAVAFLLDGLALALLGRPVTSRIQSRIAHGCIASASLLAGLTLGQDMFGWAIGLDEFLFADDTAAVATAFPGRMAPSTSVCFLLLGIALAGIQWEPRPGVRPAEVLALLAGIAAASSLAEYAVDHPLLYGFGQHTRMALHTAGAFLLLSLGVLIARPEQGLVGLLRAGRIGRREQVTYGILGALFGTVLLAGAWTYHGQEAQLRSRVEAELETIALLKAEQIHQWRAERAGDAAVLMGSHFFAEGVARWFENPDAEVAEAILTRFRSMMQHNQYAAVLLVDPQGAVHLQTSSVSHALHEETLRTLAQALRDRQPRLTNLHVPPGGTTAHLATVAPLFAGSSPSDRPIGAVILLVNANQNFFPMIQSWPRQQVTGEAVLLQRVDNDVLFLSPLRHRPDSPLSLRLPMMQTDFAIVQAVLGQQRVSEGTGYRGARVLVVPKRIPGTEWLVVAKTDEDEAFADWRYCSQLIIGIVAALALVVASAMVVIAQQQRRYHLLNATTAAIKRSEERFRSTLDFMLEGCHIIGRDWRYLYLNDAADAHNRRPKTELLGKSVLEAWPGLEATRVFAALRECMMTGVSQRLQDEITFPDGQKAWFDLGIQPVPEGVFILSTEVSERKRAEQELYFARKRFDQLVASLDDVVWTASKDGTEMRDVNRAFENLYGVSVADFATRPHLWIEMVHPEDRSLAQASANELFEKGRAAAEYRIVRPDGAVRWVLDRKSLLYDEQGRPMEIGGVATDITPLKRAEEELRQLNTLLEQRVQERTAQLIEANQELEAFVYSVSHDLRAPLRHVQGYVNMLVRATAADLPEQSARYLEVIAETSQGMGKLIDDLLEFSRLGRKEMHRQTVNLTQLVTEYVRRVEPDLHDRRIIWKIPPLPTVEGDTALLRQVIANLLDNAVKYTRRSDPAIIEVGSNGVEAGVTASDADHRDRSHVVLFVRDNGVGFDPRCAHNLFGVFQRLHRAEEFEGTGIGLANVRRIVARHGGRTWADGRPGEGATVYFTLKIAQAGPAAKEEGT